MALGNWTKEVHLATSSISVEFSKFTSVCKNSAQQRFQYMNANPSQPKLDYPTPPDGYEEYNHKLCVLLMPSIQENVKKSVFRYKKVDQITVLQILDEAWSYVSPGGMEEVKELTNYSRNPGSSNTAEEARDKMRLWRLAKKRAMGMNLPGLSSAENIMVLEKLVKEVEKIHPEFTQRIEQMKYSREAKVPNEEFIRRFTQLIDEKLKMVEADELTKKNRKRAGGVGEDLYVNQTVNETTQTGKKPPLCKHFMKHGRCGY